MKKLLLTVGLFAAILNASSQSPCKIYPNPVTDVLNITCNTSSMVSYDVFNQGWKRMIGVHGNTLNEGTRVLLDVDSWAQGMYLITFYENDSMIMSLPFIVNKEKCEGEN